MGRPSILTKISNAINVENNNNYTWLVSYNFPQNKGNPHIYELFKKLLKKLSERGARAERLQPSIILTNDYHGAIIATKLAQYYNADVHLFKVEEIDLLSYKVKLEHSDFEFVLKTEETPLVMKAVYDCLKEYYSSLSVGAQKDIFELVTFLWVIKYHIIPKSKISKDDLRRVLIDFEDLKYSDSEKILNEYQIADFGLQEHNFIPIIKALKDSYKKGVFDSIEEEIFYTIIERINDDEDIPPELKKQLEGIH